MRIALFLLSLTALYAQKAPTSIGDFSSLKVSDGINLTLIASDQNSIQISGERKEFVTVTNKDGSLKIRMKTKKKLGGFNTNVELFFNQKLEKIEAIEGAFISSNEVFMQPSIQLSTRKGGEIDLAVDVQDAVYKSDTGGKITVNGNAKDQKIRITTGGIVQAERVGSEKTEASLSGGGVADISATSLVDVKTKLGGFVRVPGNPSTLVPNKFLGGTISVVTPPQTNE